MKKSLLVVRILMCLLWIIPQAHSMEVVEQNETKDQSNNSISEFIKQSNNAVIIMNQIRDLFLLKTYMHKWFNYDKDEFELSKREILKKYQVNIINMHWSRYQKKYWNEFIRDPQYWKQLQEKYPGQIPDEIDINDMKPRYLMTIKDDFLIWIISYHPGDITSDYTNTDKIFLDEIQNYEIKQRKQVKRKIGFLLADLNVLYLSLSDILNMLPPEDKSTLKYKEHLDKIGTILEKYKRMI